MNQLLTPIFPIGGGSESVGTPPRTFAPQIQSGRRLRRSHLLWIQASLSATLSPQPMDPRTAQFYAGHAHELARRYIAAGSASPHLDPARRTRDRS
jgi:hypothetical protein